MQGSLQGRTWSLLSREAREIKKRACGLCRVWLKGEEEENVTDAICVDH